MEWKLPEERKVQYDGLLRSAQDIETTIGSMQYKIHKLSIMRADLDATLKSWWDQVIKELNLDESKNYMITKDGVVQDVSPKKEPVIKPESRVGSNASELV